MTGVVDGEHVSIRHRWIMLYNDFLPNVGGVAALSFLLAYGMVGVADVVENDQAQILAWMCPAFAAYGFLFNLLVGTRFHVG